MDETIKLDSRNYRVHDDENKLLINKSLTECGAGRSILVDRDNIVIAGNGVYEQATKLGLKVRVIESDGKELIVVKRTDLTTTDGKRKLLALADNHTSDTSRFDFSAVVEDFGVDILEDWSFDIDDFHFEDDDIKPAKNKAGALKERFIIPPFSVLDAKLGNWQERKHAWLEIGIKSEESSYKEEYANQVLKLSLLGSTDKELADFFGVSEQTLNSWKKKFPEFLESIKKGKQIADSNVASKLYNRAIGYDFEEKHFEIQKASDKDKPSTFVETKRIKKHMPSDTTAAIFWLKNR